MSEPRCQHSNCTPHMHHCPDCGLQVEAGSISHLLDQEQKSSISVLQDIETTTDSSQIIAVQNNYDIKGNTVNFLLTGHPNISKSPAKLPTTGAVDPYTLSPATVPPTEATDTIKLEQFVEVSVTLQPLPGIAVLHVYSSHEGTLSVRGTNVHESMAAIELREHPCVEWKDEHVRTQLQNNPYLAIWKLMGQFSEQNRKIGAWLKRLYDHQAIQTALSLVILDFADHELPWEMLRLLKFELDKRFAADGPIFLGALIPTVRWHTCEDIDGSPRMLLIQKEGCEGTLISYIDREDVALAGTEHDLSSVVRAMSYNDIQHWKQHLAQEEEWRGLLYIQGLTLIHDSRLVSAIGSRGHPQERLSYDELRDVLPLYLSQETSLFVFINSVSTDEITFESVYVNHSKRRCFIELFLSKGAHGVITPIGAVNYEIAPTVARNFLARLSERHDDPAPIAVILRDLRKVIAGKLPRTRGTAPDTSLLREFIYTFMYVYYGNPLASLHLLSTLTEVES